MYTQEEQRPGLCAESVRGNCGKKSKKSLSKLEAVWKKIINIINNVQHFRRIFKMLKKCLHASEKMGNPLSEDSGNLIQIYYSAVMPEGLGNAIRTVESDGIKQYNDCVAHIETSSKP